MAWETSSIIKKVKGLERWSSLDLSWQTEKEEVINLTLGMLEWHDVRIYKYRPMDS